MGVISACLMKKKSLRWQAPLSTSIVDFTAAKLTIFHSHTTIVNKKIEQRYKRCSTINHSNLKSFYKKHNLTATNKYEKKHKKQFSSLANIVNKMPT